MTNETPQRCPTCHNERVIMTKPAGASHSDDLAEYEPCPDCKGPASPEPPREDRVTTLVKLMSSYGYLSVKDVASFADLEGHIRRFLAEPTAAPAPEPPRPKSGLHHNIAKCCMEAWLDGILIGEIADGLEKEVYANWYAGLFSLVDDKNKPTAASPNPPRQYLNSPENCSHCQMMVHEYEQWCIDCGTRWPNKVGRATATVNMMPAAAPRCEDICTGCYNGLSYCDCEPAAAPTGMCESCGARLETPHVCNAHVVTAAPTGELLLESVLAENTALRSQLEEAQRETAFYDYQNGQLLKDCARLSTENAALRFQWDEAMDRGNTYAAEMTQWRTKYQEAERDLATAQARIVRLEEDNQELRAYLQGLHKP